MTNPLQPLLEGTLLTLRPLKPSDHDELYLCASDKDIWAQHPQSDRHKPEVFQQYFNGALESGGAFAVLDQATGRMIGCSRYYDFKPPEAKIGYTFLTRAYWGGLYNHELKDLMLKHIFRYCERIHLEIGRNNLRSRIATQRIGATLTIDPVGASKVTYTIERGHYLGKESK